MLFLDGNHIEWVNGFLTRLSNFGEHGEATRMSTFTNEKIMKIKFHVLAYVNYWRLATSVAAWGLHLLNNGDGLERFAVPWFDHYWSGKFPNSTSGKPKQ